MRPARPAAAQPRFGLVNCDAFQATKNAFCFLSLCGHTSCTSSASLALAGVSRTASPLDPFFAWLLPKLHCAAPGVSDIHLPLLVHQAFIAMLGSTSPATTSLCLSLTAQLGTVSQWRKSRVRQLTPVLANAARAVDEQFRPRRRREMVFSRPCAWQCDQEQHVCVFLGVLHLITGEGGGYLAQ
ncbi:uncharacterized protein N7496_005750 [Penicillium cataractarum]|uniref:Uncharacterized protein n=1 Tax=Penicillium cataractarum TaxID=2100454 RepID=A0A9W9VGC0_9EURO|nr:uncharacterized protein N7496_005750 [Penicillium cataractarum]KAJ5378341.1 hypothetical protein N7496_005750 [Penicillium cataractarum]